MLLISFSFIVACLVSIVSTDEATPTESITSFTVSTSPTCNNTAVDDTFKPKTAKKIYKECGTACPATCANLEPQMCIQACKSGWFCPPNYYENSVGECVTREDCDESPKPQPLTAPKEFKECGTACPLTCANPKPRPCNKICNRGWFCPPNYYENSAGKCVLLKLCDQPTKPRTAPKEYKQCGTACPLTCADPDPRPCILIRKPGWFCPSGYYENSEHKCVLLEDCDRRSPTPIIQILPPRPFSEPDFNSFHQTPEFPKIHLPPMDIQERPIFQISPVNYNAEDVANGAPIPPTAVVRIAGNNSPFPRIPSMVPKVKPLIDLDPTAPRPVSKHQSTDDEH